jgi:uncharacterized membrane protein YeaQ/YmgE (transglycosylase-associated protein family)
MNLFSWIIFGLIAGGVAKMIMPGDDPGSTNDLSGIVITMLIGIAGAILGGLIGSLLGMGGVNHFNIRSFALAIVGALILLYGYKRMKEHEA